MADWYVYQHDGDPLGPWSTTAVAEAILAGMLAPDVWVAAPGGPRWLRALDVPVIGRQVEGVPTKPRRDSGARLIPAAFEGDRPIPEEPAPTRRGPRPDDTAEMAAMPPMSFRLEAPAAPAADDERLARLALEAAGDEAEPAASSQKGV